MTTPTPLAGRQRQMRGRRSSRNLMRIYDRQNVARPKSNQLLIDWAQKYPARRAQESREACA